MALKIVVSVMNWKLSVQVGDLVMLAKWCKNGPELMQVMSMKNDRVDALFLRGPKAGTMCKATRYNVFLLSEYDKAMERHYANR